MATEPPAKKRRPNKLPGHPDPDYKEFKKDILLTRNMGMLTPSLREEMEELLFMKAWTKPPRRSLEVQLTIVKKESLLPYPTYLPSPNARMYCFWLHFSVCLSADAITFEPIDFFTSNLEGI